MLRTMSIKNNINAGVKVTVLGSGTSSGVPTISCNCRTCASEDPKDRRLRTSLLVQSETTTIVIDTSPDFRQQMLRHKVMKMDGIVFTHSHFDHIGGFDDIRAFNYTMRKPVRIYTNRLTMERLQRTFYYAFEIPEQLGGGVPMIDHTFIGDKSFRIGDIDISPIPLKHGKLDVLGFRIGNLAYCTDTNYIPESSRPLLENLDYLILDALRYDKHSTHFCLKEALEEVSKIQPGQTYFIHMAHEIMHSECDSSLPDTVNLAYDGLEINI